MIHAEGDYCASCVKWHDLLNSINMTVTPREVQPQKIFSQWRLCGWKRLYPKETTSLSGSNLELLPKTCQMQILQ